MSLLRQALETVYVPHCAACDVRVASGKPLCLPCNESLVELGPACPRCAEPLARPPDIECTRCRVLGEAWPLEAAVAPWRYGGALGRALRRMKFARRPDLARELAPLVAPFLGAVCRAADIEVIVPIPLHWRRLALRGFNPAQAMVEACELAPGAIDALSLKRVRATAAQSGLSGTDRVKNVKGAFDVPARRTRNLAGKRVLLVDDVITTGATMAAAARTLRGAGAAAVVAFAVARAGDD